MPYESESDLKYIDSLSEIPVSGQGFDATWTDNELLVKAETGEAKLESDVNDGDPINDPERIHSDAAATWATYRLVLGMKAPDSTTRGDSLDEGTERMNFAEALKDDYYDYVNSITQAGGDEGEDGPNTASFHVADW